MNGYSPSQRYDADSTSAVYLIVGVSAVGVAACLQFAYPGLPERALTKLPETLAHSYRVAGKYLLTVPLAALGFLLILGTALSSHRSRPSTRTAVPTRATPKSQTSLTDFYLPALLPPEPAPFLQEEELEMGEPIAEDEPEPARSLARPAQFAARRSSRSVPTGLRRTGAGTQATIELATEKYLYSRPAPGRGSHPGA